MPLDVPGCTRATMIIAVSILHSSCATIKEDVSPQKVISFLTVLHIFVLRLKRKQYDLPASKASR